jgi:hypothetical protein
MTLRTTRRLKAALLDRLDDQYPRIVKLALRNIPQIESRLSELLRCRNNSDYSDFSLIPRLWQSA